MLVPTNVLGSLAALVSAEAAHGCFGRLEARSREPITAELLRGCAALTSRSQPGERLRREPLRRQQPSRSSAAAPLELFGAALELCPRDDRHPTGASSRTSAPTGSGLRSPGLHRGRRADVFAARPAPSQDLAAAPRRGAMGQDRPGGRPARSRRYRHHVLTCSPTSASSTTRSYSRERAWRAANRTTNKRLPFFPR